MEVVDVNPSFWRGKRVLLTGHTGFKGSWMSLLLHRLGAEVVGYALAPPTGPSLYELARVGEVVTSIEADVRDAEELLAVMTEHRPEIVIHMAAQALVRHSFAEPIETYATNVMGTAHVLDAVRRVGGVRVVVCVTSDKCYENVETERPYVETDPMGGFDPYSSSKGCAELITSAYRRSFLRPDADGASVAVASVRAGNVIGGGDFARDRLVVDVMDAFARGEAVAVRNPAAVRPWQYVLDPLDGYLLVAERAWHEPARFAEAWNFGPELDDCRPVAWLVDRLAAAWGGAAGWRHDRDRHAHEAGLLLLDAAKARERLGWAPRLDLTVAVEWTVEWYRAHADGGDVAELTRQQIARHAALVPA